jgi:hypothetical protein
MPYKDPEKRRQRVREHRLELKQSDSQAYEEMLEYHRQHLRKYRGNLTQGEKEERLRKRRERRYELNPGSKPRPNFKSDDDRKEHKRKYHREYARALYKKDPKAAIASNQEYWRNTTKERKQNRLEKKSQYTRNFRMAHPDAPMIYYKRNKEKWTDGLDCREPKIWKTAEKKAMGLVERLGYTDLFQPDFVYFYFDMAAKKDGRIAVFQVTTLRIRNIKRKHIELANYLGLDYFLIQVRPSLDIAYVSRIDTSVIPSSKSVNFYYARGTQYSLE